MLSKTIEKEDRNNKNYRSLQDAIKKDKDLDEYMLSVEQESSKKYLKGNVKNVYMDDDNDNTVVEYNVMYCGRTIKVEEKFQLPDSNSDDYRFVQLLRDMYGENVGLHKGVERLKRENELPVKFDENSIKGVEINYKNTSTNNVKGRSDRNDKMVIIILSIIGLPIILSPIMSIFLNLDAVLKFSIWWVSTGFIFLGLFHFTGDI